MRDPQALEFRTRTPEAPPEEESKSELEQLEELSQQEDESNHEFLIAVTATIPARSETELFIEMLEVTDRIALSAEFLVLIFSMYVL